MRKVILIFPDTSLLTEFLLRFQTHQIEVSSKDKTINGLLDEDAIVIACTEYNALLHKSQIIDY